MKADERKMLVISESLEIYHIFEIFYNKVLKFKLFLFFTL